MSEMFKVGVESTIARFLDFVFYDYFRKNYFKDLLFCSSDIMQKRRALLSGVALPAVVLWRTKSPYIAQADYGRSVLARSLFVPEWGDKTVTTRIIDYTVNYNIYAEGYFVEYVNKVAETLVNFDILRYFRLDMDAYLPKFKTRVEFMLDSAGIEFTPNVDDETERRRFFMNFPFNVKITIPKIEEGFFIEKIVVYLNEQKIYEINLT